MMNTESVGDDRPLVPEGVLEGIDDIKNGNTATRTDLEAALNF